MAEADLEEVVEEASVAAGAASEEEGEGVALEAGEVEEEEGVALGAEEGDSGEVVEEDSGAAEAVLSGPDCAFCQSHCHCIKPCLCHPFLHSIKELLTVSLFVSAHCKMPARPTL